MDTTTTALTAQTQSRFWCLTINNPLAQIESLPVGCRYLVSGEEVGESGTPHLQMYLELSRAQRMAYVKKLFPTAHIEVRKGTGPEAADYCKKDGKFVEFGEADKVGQAKGKRNDLKILTDAVVAGAPMKEIASIDPAAYVRNYRGLASLKNVLKTPEKFRKMFACWLFVGKTRTGKSYHARIALDAFPKPIGKGLWWDGYDGEKTVVIDEFRGQFPLSDMLQLMDPYKVQVEVKGGFTFFEPDTLILTTNDHPADWYLDHTEDTREAFLARFKKVFWFYDAKTFKYLTLDDEQRDKYLLERVLPKLPSGEVSVVPHVSVLARTYPATPGPKRRSSTQKTPVNSPDKGKQYWDVKAGAFLPIKQKLLSGFKRPRTTLHQDEQIVEPISAQHRAMLDIESSDEEISISTDADSDIDSGEDDSEWSL